MIISILSMGAMRVLAGGYPRGNHRVHEKVFLQWIPKDGEVLDGEKNNHLRSTRCVM